HGLTIETTIGSQGLARQGRDAFEGLSQEPDKVAGSIGTAARQMTEKHLPFLSPKGKQGGIADLAIVRFGRALFGGGSLLIDARVKVNRTVHRLRVRPNLLLQPQLYAW